MKTGEWATIVHNIASGACGYPLDHIAAAACIEFMADEDWSGWTEHGGHCEADREAIEEMLRGTPFEGDLEMVTLVCRQIDKTIAARRSEIGWRTVWITNEATGRAHLTDEKPESDGDYVEIGGDPDDLLERAVSLDTAGCSGSAWSWQASREILDYLHDEALVVDEIELTEDELKTLDDGQGWWGTGDRVRLTTYNGLRHLALVVDLRGTRPDDPRRMDVQAIENGDADEYGWDDWTEAVKLPKAIRARLIRSDR